MPTGLLESVKNHLDITWEDANTDAKITGIINRGMKFLNDKAGAELDYSVDDRPREALLEYCEYARGKRLNEFMEDYGPFLTDLKVRNGGVYGKTTNL